MSKSLSLPLALLLVTTVAAGKTPFLPKKEMQAWEEGMKGRVCYLTETRLPLLVNDAVEVVDCRIRRGEVQLRRQGGRESVVATYHAEMLFRGRRGAPGHDFRWTATPTSRESLEKWIVKFCSPTPLEDAYDWAKPVKDAVRARYIALGMNADMVHLALGGWAYQVDQELLDDGRVRETWKLQLRGDSRRIFASRTVVATSTSEATLDLGSLAATLGTVSVTSRTLMHARESGFFVFSGLPPEFLHIEFTDGRVTARRTEFVD